MSDAPGNVLGQTSPERKQRQPAASGLLSTSEPRLGYTDDSEAMCQLMCRLSRRGRAGTAAFTTTPLAAVKASGSGRTDL